MIFQRAIKKEVSAIGVGLHSGEKVRITLKPSKENSGMIFKRTDLDLPVEINVEPKAIKETRLSSTIGKGKNKISTISANIDASQPWRRSHCDNVIYTDLKRDNFLRAIVSIIGRDDPPKNIGLENDHVTLDMREKIGSIFTFSVFSDVSK